MAQPLLATWTVIEAFFSPAASCASSGWTSGFRCFWGVWHFLWLSASNWGKISAALPSPDWWYSVCWRVARRWSSRSWRSWAAIGSSLHGYVQLWPCCLVCPQFWSWMRSCRSESVGSTGSPCWALATLCAHLPTAGQLSSVFPPVCCCRQQLPPLNPTIEWLLWLDGPGSRNGIFASSLSYLPT